MKTPPIHLPVLPARFCRVEWLLVAGCVCGAGFGGIAGLWWCAGIACAAAFLLLPRRFAAAFALAAALGTAVLLLRDTPRSGEIAALLDGQPRVGEAVVRLADSSLAAKPDEYPPRMIEAEIRRIRLSGDPDFQNVRGKILLFLPEANPMPVTYGDILAVEGSFRPPDSAIAVETDSQGNFVRILRERWSFADYQLGRGFAATATIQRAMKIAAEPGWYAILLAARDRLVAWTNEGLTDARCRAESAALFFGRKSALPATARNDAIRSGTIHVFVVSGFHVGVIAAILLLCLKGVPFRARYLAVPPLLLVFVLAVGANLPAWRAWWMVSAWCWLRALLFVISPISALGWVAAAFLLWNPRNMTDAGFLYSFVISLALLLLARSWREWQEIRQDRFALMPVDAHSYRMRRIQQKWYDLAATGAGCVVAFLAGGGISLACQGLWLPGSLGANLLILPLAGLLFPVMIAKIALGWLAPWIDGALGAVLQWGLLAMETLSSQTARWFGSSSGVNPVWWELALFYAALWAVIRPGDSWRMWRRLAGVLAIGAVLAWWHRPQHEFAVAVCRTAPGSPPMIAIADGVHRVGCAVNVPGRAAAALAAELWKNHGIDQVGPVRVTAVQPRTLGGLPALLRAVPVGQVELPPLDNCEPRLLASLQQAAALFPEVRFLPENEAGMLRMDADGSIRYRDCRIRWDGNAVTVQYGSEVKRRSFDRAWNLPEYTCFRFKK